MIDNTPPIVTVLSAARAGRHRATLSGKRRMRVAPAARRVSVDAAGWVPMDAADGVIDSLREKFVARPRQPRPGEHLVALRAADSANKHGSREGGAEVGERKEERRQESGVRRGVRNQECPTAGYDFYLLFLSSVFCLLSSVFCLSTPNSTRYLSPARDIRRRLRPGTWSAPSAVAELYSTKPSASTPGHCDAAVQKETAVVPARRQALQPAPEIHHDLDQQPEHHQRGGDCHARRHTANTRCAVPVVAVGQRRSNVAGQPFSETVMWGCSGRGPARGEPQSCGGRAPRRRCGTGWSPPPSAEGWTGSVPGWRAGTPHRQHDRDRRQQQQVCASKPTAGRSLRRPWRTRRRGSRPAAPPARSETRTRP